jgi:hypothetical protein
MIRFLGGSLGPRRICIGSTMPPDAPGFNVKVAAPRRASAPADDSSEAKVGLLLPIRAPCRYIERMKLPLDGGCRCDAVRFRLAEAPLMETACHCNGCQRMSSSAFSLSVICLAPAFTVTQGTPVIGGLHGPEAQHFFCGHCMTWIFTRPVPLPHIVNVRPTMFDDHAWFAPYMETFTRAKLPWAQTGAVRSFEDFPPLEAYEGLMKEYAGTRR